MKQATWFRRYQDFLHPIKFLPVYHYTPDCHHLLLLFTGVCKRLSSTFYEQFTLAREGAEHYQATENFTVSPQIWHKIGKTQLGET